VAAHEDPALQWVRLSDSIEYVEPIVSVTQDHVEDEQVERALARSWDLIARSGVV
jgi:hypothetical protein